jgi:hypothetical protein
MSTLAQSFWFGPLGPFGSPGMLLWAAAAAIPIAIHLLSRRRFDEVPWAAMDFLMAALRKHARRMRLEQLLLLLIRASILALLGIALANPVLSLWHSPPALGVTTGDTHVVLVIDGSYSMDYRDGDVTRFDRARSRASELVRDSLQGDGFSLILLATPAAVVVGDPVFDREDVVNEIADLRRTDGSAELASALAEIDRVLDRGARREPRLRERRVYFFTDLGRTTWGDVSTNANQAALRRLADKAVLHVIDVGEPSGQNLAVTRVGVTEGVVTVDHPTRIDVEVANFGNQDLTHHALEVLVDGQRIAEEYVDVPAGGRATASVVHPFPLPGEHVVEVQAAEDRLTADNRRWLSLDVRPALEVLCVEGRAGAARNIVFALDPAVSGQSRVRASVQSEIALLEADLERFDCLMLCNVGRFGQDEARLLRMYLEQGGGLVVFLGDQVQAASYNSVLGSESGASALLPAQIGEPVPLGAFAFDPLDYRHPIVQPFRGHERAGLLTTPIWKYVRLQVGPQSESQVALAFDNGDPAIVESPVGRGHVILIATDGSDSSLDHSTTPPSPWNAWSAWPSFPPLVQQILKEAVRGRTPLRNVAVGDLLRGRLPPGSAESTVVISDPAGRDLRVSAETQDAGRQWSFADTRRSGVYSVALGGAAGDIDRFAVNVDTRESQLERVDASSLPSQLQTQLLEETASSGRADGGGSSQLFRYLLAAVLLLLMCESFLAWFFGRSDAHVPLAS